MKVLIVGNMGYVGQELEVASLFRGIAEFFGESVQDQP
jgi:hypothetical protein